MNVEYPKLKTWERLNPETGQIIRVKPTYCSAGWAYSSVSQHVARMNCKRRDCPTCGWYWRHKWRCALKEKSACDEFTKNIKPRLALTLTTAQKTDHKQMWNCLRYFWQLMRKSYPDVQYWGVVEVNQKHSLIHFHFLLAGYNFIPYAFIRKCWMKAQEWAGFDKLAFEERIERIQKNVEAYFTKYLTKAAGGLKDEIPTKADWSARHIRYSRAFFGVPIAAMAAAAKFKAALASDEEIDRLSYLARKPLAALSGFIEKCDREQITLVEIVNRPWLPASDRYKAKPAIDNQPVLTLEYNVETTLPSDGRTFIQTCRDMAIRQSLDN
jgi:hypothetical protein